jgi:hypothetical protein
MMNHNEFDILELFEAASGSVILGPAYWQRALKNFLSHCLNSDDVSVHLKGKERKEFFIQIILQHIIYRRQKMIKDTDNEFDSMCTLFNEEINTLKDQIEHKLSRNEIKRDESRDVQKKVDTWKDKMQLFMKTKEIEKMLNELNHLDELKNSTNPPKEVIEEQEKKPSELRTRLTKIGDLVNSLKVNEVVTQSAVESLIVLSREDVALEPLYWDAKKGEVDFSVMKHFNLTKLIGN